MDGSCGAPHATATRGEVISPRGPSIPRARKGTPLSGAERPQSPIINPLAQDPERPGLAALSDRASTATRGLQHPPPLPSVQHATRGSSPRAPTRHSSLPRGESAAPTPSPAPTAPPAATPSPSPASAAASFSPPSLPPLSLSAPAPALPPAPAAVAAAAAEACCGSRRCCRERPCDNVSESDSNIRENVSCAASSS